MSKSKAKPLAKSITHPTVSEAVPSFLVKFAQLVPSPKNVRRYNSEDGISELKASLSAHGLITDIRVRDRADGKLEVVAGSRRFRALKELAKEGGAIKGRKVTPNYLVRVSYQEADDDDAEISLAENVQRSAMHPADEAQAFMELAEADGMTPEAIADRFGISHMTVRRRMKLAKVSPKIIDAFREGNATLEQMEALALADDHAKQEAAFFDAPEWALSPRELRQRLTQGAVALSSPIARFITAEAYEAAGGVIIRDLFSTEGLTYLENRALVYELADAKLRPIFADLLAEGWKWAEVVTGWAGNQSVVPKMTGDYSAEDRAAYEALQDRDEALSVEWEAAEGETNEELQASLNSRQQEITSQMDEIDARYMKFDAAEMKFAGVAVRIDNDGALSLSRGIVRSEDIAAWRAFQAGEPTENEDDDENNEGGGEAEPEEDNSGPSYSMAVVEDLTAYKTAVLAVEMARRPNVALVVAVHAMALDHFKEGKYYSGYHYEPACRLRSGRSHIKIDKVDDDNQGAVIETKNQRAEWFARLPEDPANLWDWLMEQRPPILMDLFAYLVGQSLDVWRQRHQSSPRFSQGDQVAVALGVDMAKWWTPSEAFFQRVPKSVALSALAETGKPEKYVANVAKDAKGDVVRTAVEDLNGTGWLPAP